MTDLTKSNTSGLYCIYDTIGNCRYSSFFEYTNNYIAIRSFIKFLDSEFPIENCKEERTKKMNEISRQCFCLKRVAIFEEMKMIDSSIVTICSGNDADEIFQNYKGEASEI